jgi:hypothetical protein
MDPWRTDSRAERLLSVINIDNGARTGRGWVCEIEKGSGAEEGWKTWDVGAGRGGVD